MVLWVILGAVFVIACGVFKLCGSSGFSRYFEWGRAFGGFFITLFCGAVAGGILLLILLASNEQTTEYRDTEVITWELKALGNDTQISGRSFFLGGGYIGGKKVINFITKDGSGAIRVEQLNATDAKIFEDSQKPVLIRTKTVSAMPWLVPWDLRGVYHYDFHIPAGSVLESYSVDVNK